MVLCKDNQRELDRTLKSLPYSTKKIEINLKIIDGSKTKLNIRKYNNDFLNKKIDTFYYNSEEKKIRGIYPSMNYALSKVDGDWIIFMNSGDEFFNTSLLKNIEEYLLLDPKVKIFFGRAIIIGKRSWTMPSKNVSSIKNWLKFIKPNHQSMFISKSVLIDNKFNVLSPSQADHEWKRKLLRDYKYLFIPKNICKFHLGGISSKYSFKLLKLKLSEKKRTKLSKFFEICKYFLYKLNFDVELLQLLKNYLISLIT